MVYVAAGPLPAGSQVVGQSVYLRTAITTNPQSQHGLFLRQASPKPVNRLFCDNSYGSDNIQCPNVHGRLLADKPPLLLIDSSWSTPAPSPV